MKYISAKEAADKWGISQRRVSSLCAENRIIDAQRVGNMWTIIVDGQEQVLIFGNIQKANVIAKF